MNLEEQTQFKDFTTPVARFLNRLIRSQVKQKALRQHAAFIKEMLVRGLHLIQWPDVPPLTTLDDELSNRRILSKRPGVRRAGRGGGGGGGGGRSKQHGLGPNNSSFRRRRTGGGGGGGGGGGKRAS